MGFCWCTINVKDMEASLNFYKDIVGLPINRRISIGSKEMVFLGEGETKIELVYHEGAEEITIGKDISLGFEVTSLQEKMKHLKEKGIEVMGDIISPNPHISFFFIKDPNGLSIQFVENK